MQANPVSSFLHYLNDQYEWELRGHARPAWPPHPGLVKDKHTEIHRWNVDVWVEKKFPDLDKTTMGLTERAKDPVDEHFW